MASWFGLPPSGSFGLQTPAAGQQAHLACHRRPHSALNRLLAGAGKPIWLAPVGFIWLENNKDLCFYTEISARPHVFLKASLATSREATCRPPLQNIEVGLGLG